MINIDYLWVVNCLSFPLFGFYFPLWFEVFTTNMFYHFKNNKASLKKL